MQAIILGLREGVGKKFLPDINRKSQPRRAHTSMSLTSGMNNFKIKEESQHNLNEIVENECTLSDDDDDDDDCKVIFKTDDKRTEQEQGATS